MRKAAGFYLVALTGLSLSVWRPSLGWLAPTSLLVLLLGVLWLWLKGGLSVRELGFQVVAGWPRMVGRGLMLGLSLPILLVVVEMLSGWLGLAPTSRPLTDSLRLVLLGGVKISFLITLEEVVFRGYFLQRLRIERGMWFGLLSSSLLWALMHVPSMVGAGLTVSLILSGVVTWTILGAALGISYMGNMNTLWFPVGLHYGYNFVHSLIGTLAERTYNASVWLVGHPAWAPETGILGILMAAGILAVVGWITRHKMNSA